jgi:hypothetical protein
VDTDSDGYSISWLVVKWRNLQKEKMKKKLGNVWQVLVATKTGDPQKEDSGAFRGINRNQAPPSAKTASFSVS